MLTAQITLELRRQVVAAAGVDDFDVSLTLLLRDLPWLVREGPRVGSLRPSRRRRRELPDLRECEPPPPDLPRTRLARYADRTCGPKQTDRRPAPALTRNESDRMGKPTPLRTRCGPSL